MATCQATRDAPQPGRLNVGRDEVPAVRVVAGEVMPVGHDRFCQSVAGTGCVLDEPRAVGLVDPVGRSGQ